MVRLVSVAPDTPLLGPALPCHPEQSEGSAALSPVFSTNGTNFDWSLWRDNGATLEKAADPSFRSG
jgi:hypothetical protein